ncbi:MAG: DUF1549 domain-containing protein, partial [Phycisphaerales bacterium]|nr:DUF1549 domain-containing protein [Phycisphaerales bacterium]
MIRIRDAGWIVTIGLVGTSLGLIAAAHHPHTALVASASLASADDGWEAVREVLERRCLDCHGGHERESGLSFATASTFAEGGSRGPVLSSDSLEASRLLHVIGYTDPNLAMPPTGQLPADDYAVLERWILDGAPWPEDETGRLADPDAHPLVRTSIKGDANWWAYQPLMDVPTPVVADEAWNADPIDALIRARLDDAGLEPVGLATPEQLIRRATFDLTGLPPTPDEVDRFLHAYESDPDGAWSALVDRLLDDPAYGEHWARHWLDQVRYAETNGYERDGTKTNIWRYRDWVIRALNDDMPYDRFLIEQLAGDELAMLRPDEDVDDAALIATGYYRLGVWDDEPADPVQARADELADVVDTTGQVFMGMTVGCARCHDHKADPISQKDYYALTAFFNNITGFGGGRYGQALDRGMTRPVADAPGECQLTIPERDATLERLFTEFREALGDAAPSDTSSRVLLPDARQGGVEWKYRTGPAPDGATLQSFDDTDWQTGKGGFGTDGTPGAIVGTVWDTKRLTIRTRFGLDQMPDGVILSIHHDEEADVFINGVPVASLTGFRQGYGDFQLPREAMNALVIGSNTITVICRQSVGGQYIDVGLRSGWLDTDDAWVIRLHARAGEAPSPDAERLASEIR